MQLPVNFLRSKYQELTDAIIEQVNSGYITLYFDDPRGGMIPNSGTFNEPSNFIGYGGRAPLTNSTERFNESATGVHNQPAATGIRTRVYWKPKAFQRDGVMVDTDNMCKLNTYSEYKQLLENATYGVVDGNKVKLAFPPELYGLFGHDYCISYWERISDGI